MANKKYSLPFFFGYFLIIASAVIFIFNLAPEQPEIAFYVFCAGATLNIVFRFFLLPRSDNKRIRRLNNQQFFVAILFIGAGYMLFETMNSWIVPLFLAAVIDVWLSFRYEKIKD
ncbi:MAG: hypothetical protein LBN95_09060 [Prevotellaceae bacterium]|jgi:uncharacterized membrane protein YfcA|nr:hypothetical protein [Prevotellaceae bacterium]